MRYITTGERIGYERGKQEGEQKGEQKGKQQLILRLLQRRVGELSPELQERIQSLSLNKLETLGEALLDFTAMEDLLNWLQTNQSV
jgi:predicted transposase YdaD